MNFAPALRRDLAHRAQNYAQQNALPHCLSYGEPPTICFEPYEEGSRHGNFTPSSYQAIQGNSSWKRRLTKVHTQGQRSLPRTDRGRWMELDSCVSSDALMMNMFCYPAVSRQQKISALLGVDPDACLTFGFRPRVPLLSGRLDRTEVDLKWGDLLIEAKLTETDFQSCKKDAFLYRDFSDVFDHEELPQTRDRYESYQLLRNVLAAYALRCSFCVLVDARRPDLIDAWYGVLKCVKLFELRSQLRILTWQELAAASPRRLQLFLEAKYGIAGTGVY